MGELDRHGVCVCGQAPQLAREGACLALDAADELQFALRLDPPAADGLRFARGELTHRGADSLLGVRTERVGLHRAPRSGTAQLKARRAWRAECLAVTGLRFRPQINFAGYFNIMLWLILIAIHRIRYKVEDVRSEHTSATHCDSHTLFLSFRRIGRIPLVDLLVLSMAVSRKTVVLISRKSEDLH
jgi:hypothetical protein